MTTEFVANVRIEGFVEGDIDVEEYLKDKVILLTHQDAEGEATITEVEFFHAEKSE